MAPSSTPSDASRRSLLAARDARQAALDGWRGEGTLVALSLAVPGAEKTPPGAAALFDWAAGEVGRAFPGARLLERRVDALGPTALFAVPAPAPAAKRRCVAIEAARPAARLIDLDVYSSEGAPIDRALLRLPPRSCLCCDAAARECIRAGRHGFPALAARARALLEGDPAGPARGGAGGGAPP